MRRTVDSIANNWLLTVADVASFLRVSRSLVYQLVETGHLRACRIGCGREAIRIKREELLQFIDARQIAAGEAVTRPARRGERLKHLKI